MKVENGKADKKMGKGERTLFNDSTMAFLLIGNNKQPHLESPNHQGNYFLLVVL